MTDVSPILPDDGQIGSGNTFSIAPAGVRIALIALIILMGGFAMFAWLGYYAALSTEQPLSITACDPATYDRPEGTTRGPSQADCDRVFEARGDQWDASEPAVVVGQVCNDSDQIVSYRVEVALVPLDLEAARIFLLDVPIDYDPGCQPFYEFGFEVPASLTAGAEPGESLGQWRIVGRAIPRDTRNYEPYSWDAVSTVEIIAG